jgi:hypothetical protein
MAIYANLVVDQGTDFSSFVTLEDTSGAIVDLTGYTAAGMIRRTYLSTSSTSFTTSIPDPTTGEIKIQLASSVTGAMKAGRYVYDLEITSSGGAVSRVVEGQLEVNPGVTY